MGFVYVETVGVNERLYTFTFLPYLRDYAPDYLLYLKDYNISITLVY